MHHAGTFVSDEDAREDLEVILKSGVSTAVQLTRRKPSTWMRRWWKGRGT